MLTFFKLTLSVSEKPSYLSFNKIICLRESAVKKFTGMKRPCKIVFEDDVGVRVYFAQRNVSKF